MHKLSQILKITQLFILLPFHISRGSKKRAYVKIKKTIIAANLFYIFKSLKNKKLRTRMHA